MYIFLCFGSYKAPNFFNRYTSFLPKSYVMRRSTRKCQNIFLWITFVAKEFFLINFQYIKITNDIKHIKEKPFDSWLKILSSTFCINKSKQDWNQQTKQIQIRAKNGFYNGLFLWRFHGLRGLQIGHGAFENHELQRNVREVCWGVSPRIAIGTVFCSSPTRHFENIWRWRFEFGGHFEWVQRVSIILDFIRYKKLEKWCRFIFGK